jgi:signal transduction histidine kinase
MQRTRTMAALGEMSATVAHEIRNPLGAMGIWAGLLDRDIPAEDPRKKTLSKIIEGLARLNRIVSNLLVYTRPVKAEFRKVNLHALVREILDFMEIEIERQGQAVTVDKSWDDKEPVYVMADPEKMQQVIMNLCQNAVQAMPRGGSLIVRVDKPLRSPATTAFFRIADTGIGIDKENITKIFDPFFTTKENGTGLGLAIVKKFIESHAGTIEVQSQPGKGTEFTVYLPLAN